jgi:hypothetical protein
MSNWPFIPDTLVDTATQSETSFFSDLDTTTSTTTDDSPAPLEGTGSTLYHQYQDNVHYYLDRLDSSMLSGYRAEVFNRVRQQAAFQAQIFGRSAATYDTFPASTCATFTVSLHLVVYTAHFIFSTTCPGYDKTGNLNEDLTTLLSYFDQQVMPPQLLEQLRKLTLVWYDGGLICEIEDQRRPKAHPMRIFLRVHPDDIAACGFEIEQEYLFTRFPSLCLEPTLQVGKVARVAARDREKWKPPSESGQTPAAFMHTEYPSLFIEEPEPRAPRARRESSLTDEELRERLLRRFGLA